MLKISARFWFCGCCFWDLCRTSLGISPALGILQSSYWLDASNSLVAHTVEQWTWWKFHLLIRQVPQVLTHQDASHHLCGIGGSPAFAHIAALHQILCQCSQLAKVNVRGDDLQRVSNLICLCSCYRQTGQTLGRCVG